MTPYTEQAASAQLSTLTGWAFRDNGIEKKYVFSDFIEAMGFIQRLALLSEKANHHAEIFNVYNRVNIRLSTHDAGGVTDKDFALAKQLENILS